MTATVHPADHVPHDDPDVRDAMALLDTLTDAERRAILSRTVQASLAYARSGDVAHVTGLARNLLATVELRRHPEYTTLPPRRRAGRGLDIAEVLARLD